jgi:hypothetical protein
MMLYLKALVLGWPGLLFLLFLIAAALIVGFLLFWMAAAFAE